MRRHRGPRPGRAPANRPPAVACRRPAAAAPRAAPAAHAAAPPAAPPRSAPPAPQRRDDCAVPRPAAPNYCFARPSPAACCSDLRWRQRRRLLPRRLAPASGSRPSDESGGAPARPAAAVAPAAPAPVAAAAPAAAACGSGSGCGRAVLRCRRRRSARRRVVMPQTGPRPTYSAPPPPPGRPQRPAHLPAATSGQQGRQNPAARGPGASATGSGRAPADASYADVSYGHSGRWLRAASRLCARGQGLAADPASWVWEPARGRSGGLVPAPGEAPRPSRPVRAGQRGRGAPRYEKNKEAALKGLAPRALAGADSAGRAADHQDHHRDRRHLREGPRGEAGCSRQGPDRDAADEGRVRDGEPVAGWRAGEGSGAAVWRGRYGHLGRRAVGERGDRRLAGRYDRHGRGGAGAGGYDHGPRRSRQDFAAGCDPVDGCGGWRGRRNHAAHRRLQGEASPSRIRLRSGARLCSWIRRVTRRLPGCVRAERRSRTSS